MPGLQILAATQAPAEDGVLEWVAAVGTLVSALVAVVALIVAVRSSRDSKRSAKAAEDSATAAAETSKAMEESLRIARETSGYVVQQVAMQRAEHEAFLAERASRPKLTVAMRLLPGDSRDGRVEKNRGTVTYRQLEVAVRNDGTKTAEAVNLNVIVPVWLTAHWSHPGGGEVAGANPPAPADTKVADANGDLHEAQYLYRVFNVPQKAEEAQWVRFQIPANVESIPFLISVNHESLEEHLLQRFMVTAVFTDQR